ncbi:MAG TPA: hypothetical protein VGM90_18035 [Kofleriaceae bacterium]
MTTLRIAWWNTRLATKPGNGARAERTDLDAETWEIALQVVHDLASEGVEIILLGEVVPSTVARLRTATTYERVVDDAIDVDTGIGALFDATKCSVRFDANVVGELRSRDTTRALRFSIDTADAPQIALIAVHWPSRSTTEGEVHRAPLASGLQTHINNLVDQGPGFVIIGGDFNEDPFDDSLTLNLFGTRDRRLAAKQRRALYNPFWRLLGERKTHETAPPHHGAGTCFWKGSTETKWTTFDQFMFSSAFLQGGAWTLVEGATEVWDRPPLAVDDGKLRPGFDHYPVLVGIRRVVGGAVL